MKNKDDWYWNFCPLCRCHFKDHIPVQGICDNCRINKTDPVTLEEFKVWMLSGLEDTWYNRRIKDAVMTYLEKKYNRKEKDDEK